MHTVRPIVRYLAPMAELNKFTFDRAGKASGCFELQSVPRPRILEELYELFPEIKYSPFNGFFFGQT